jgi:hypothetical protein
MQFVSNILCIKQITHTITVPRWYEKTTHVHCHYYSAASNQRVAWHSRCCRCRCHFLVRRSVSLQGVQTAVDRRRVVPLLLLSFAVVFHRQALPLQAIDRHLCRQCLLPADQCYVAAAWPQRAGLMRLRPTTARRTSSRQGRPYVVFGRRNLLQTLRASEVLNDKFSSHIFGSKLVFLICVLCWFR